MSALRAETAEAWRLRTEITSGKNSRAVWIVACAVSVAACAPEPYPVFKDLGNIKLSITSKEGLCSFHGATSDSVSLIIAPPAQFARGCPRGQFGLAVIVLADKAKPLLVGGAEFSDIQRIPPHADLGAFVASPQERYALVVFSATGAQAVSIGGQPAWVYCNNTCTIVYRFNGAIVRLIWNREEIPISTDEAVKHVSNTLKNWSL